MTECQQLPFNRHIFTLVMWYRSFIRLTQFDGVDTYLWPKLFLWLKSRKWHSIIA